METKILQIQFNKAEKIISFLNIDDIIQKGDSHTEIKSTLLKQFSYFIFDYKKVVDYFLSESENYDSVNFLVIEAEEGEFEIVEDVTYNERDDVFLKFAKLSTGEKTIGRRLVEVAEFYKSEPLKKLYFTLMEVAEALFGQKIDIFDITNITDRDLIECIQEFYSFIFCRIEKIKYDKNFNVGKYIETDEFFKWIADYKMKHFAKEILAENGMELLERKDNGFMVRELLPQTDIIQ